MVAAANGILFQSSVYSSHSNLPPLPPPVTVHCTVHCPPSLFSCVYTLRRFRCFRVRVYTQVHWKLIELVKRLRPLKAEKDGEGGEGGEGGTGGGEQAGEDAGAQSGEGDGDGGVSEGGGVAAQPVTVKEG